MITIKDTNTKYDNKTFECLDRGSAIIIDSDGVYHIDLLVKDYEESCEVGRCKNAKIKILKQ